MVKHLWKLAHDYQNGLIKFVKSLLQDHPLVPFWTASCATVS